MSVIVKANGPADLLAMTPSLVGFTPQQSFVLLAFRGKRTCGAMRFNLPTSTSEAVLKRIATSAVGTLCRITGVDGVVVAIYTDESIGADGLPHDEFADVLGRRLHFSGIDVREMVCRASNGWGSYFDAETPVGGHPLSDIANSPVVANLPPEALPDDAATSVRVPDAPLAERKRVKKALARYRELAASLKDDTGAVPAELQPLDDLTEFVERALEWDESATRANDALLLFALQGPPIRDLTMLQWASNLAMGDVILDEAERWSRSGGTLTKADVETSPNLMLGQGPRPDPDRIERGIQLLQTVVSRAEDVERLAPLCMLAWLNWALGRATRAGRHIDEARAIDPNYGMAELLDTILSNGMMPEWAFAEPARME